MVKKAIASPTAAAAVPRIEYVRLAFPDASFRSHGMPNRHTTAMRQPIVIAYSFHVCFVR
jgi:hypothetical protein